MHGGGNRIYGRHRIVYNGQFAECEVLENISQVRVQGQGLVNWSSRNTGMMLRPLPSNGSGDDDGLMMMMMMTVTLVP